MISSLGRRLRLVLGMATDQVDGTWPGSAEPGRTQELDFTAYAEDSRLYGRIQLDAERLTDMLNEHDELTLVNAMVESLADGRTYQADEFTIQRDELLVVEAFGPRGSANRRQRTRPHAMAVKLGPYEIRGYLHVSPTADPLIALRRRKPIVPLTDAALEFTCAGVRQVRRHSTMLFNRESMDWIAPTVDDLIEFPEMPVSGEKSGMEKDFTGDLLTFDG
jgi:hypothetical protein